MQTAFDISVPVDLQLYSAFPFFSLHLRNILSLIFQKNIY